MPTYNVEVSDADVVRLEREAQRQGVSPARYLEVQTHLHLIGTDGPRRRQKPGGARKERLRAITLHLASHPAPITEADKVALAEQFGVDVRTIYRDLDFLAAVGGPVIKAAEGGEQRRKRGPRYLDEHPEAEVKPKARNLMALLGARPTDLDGDHSASRTERPDAWGGASQPAIPAESPEDETAKQPRRHSPGSVQARSVSSKSEANVASGATEPS